MCTYTKGVGTLAQTAQRFQTLNRCEPVHFSSGPCPVQGRVWLEQAAPIKAADRFFAAGSPLAQVPAWQRNCITQRRASHHGKANVCSAATSCNIGGGGGSSSSSEAGQTRQLLRRCRGLTRTSGAALDAPRFIGRSFLNELAAEGMARERRYDEVLQHQQQRPP
jgi:hypothetical protein